MVIPPDRLPVACAKVFPELRPIAGNLLPVILDLAQVLPDLQAVLADLAHVLADLPAVAPDLLGSRRGDQREALVP